MINHKIIKSLALSAFTFAKYKDLQGYLEIGEPGLLYSEAVTLIASYFY